MNGCAYRVQISNSTSSESGYVYRIVMVFAVDFVEATMKAQEAVDLLKKSLIRVGLPKEAADSLEIDRVELECVIVGDVGVLRRDETERFETVDQWAARIAKRTRDEANL